MDCAKAKARRLVLQNPLNMKYLRDEDARVRDQGEKVEKRIDTGAQVITKANMDEPAQKQLLSPNLKVARRVSLVAAGITKAFGATQALAGVDLDAAAGEIYRGDQAERGGKSTLMAILAGAIAPDAGTITRSSGAPYAPGSPRAARTSGVAMVHQELSLCPHLSVTEKRIAQRAAAAVRVGRLVTRARKLARKGDRAARRRDRAREGRLALDREPAARRGRARPLPDAACRACSSSTNRRAASARTTPSGSSRDFESCEHARPRDPLLVTSSKGRRSPIASSSFETGRASALELRRRRRSMRWSR